MELSYAFVIFFISLGPLKIIPPFYLATANISESDVRKIALKGILNSLIIVIVIGIIADQLLQAWKLSLPAFIMAGGILLFLTSVKSVLKFKGIKLAPVENEELQVKELTKTEINQRALSPVTIPIIISPVGLVAVIAVLSIAHIYHDILEVVGLLMAIMIMNLICMIYARIIMKAIGLPVFSIIGWAFAILQAGLAVQFIVNSISKLFGL